MKKIFSIVFAGLAMLSLVGCSASDYNDKYEDPSKTTTVGVPQVFTSVLISGNTWMNPVYYRYYTQSTTSGLFSGVIGDYNSRGRFRGASEGYFNARWTNFYSMLAQYRLLQTTYENLTDMVPVTFGKMANMMLQRKLAFTMTMKFFTSKSFLNLRNLPIS